MDSCSHCVDCLVPNSDLHLKQRGVIIEDILWRRKTRFMVPCLTACVSSSIRFFALCEIPYNPYCKETAWHSGRLYSTLPNRIKWCLCSCGQYDKMKNQFVPIPIYSIQSFYVIAVFIPSPWDIQRLWCMHNPLPKEIRIDSSVLGNPSCHPLIGSGLELRHSYSIKHMAVYSSWRLNLYEDTLLPKHLLGYNPCLKFALSTSTMRQSVENKRGLIQSIVSSRDTKVDPELMLCSLQQYTSATMQSLL